MQQSRARHVVTLVSALAIPMLAVTILIPGAASATPKPKAVKGTCTHLAGNFTVTSGSMAPKLSGCSPSPNAPGTGTFTFPAATSGNTTIHWSNGSSTKFSFTTKLTLPTKMKKGASVANSKFHCPSGDQIEAALKGKIPNSGGNANLPTGDTGLKGAVKATVCVSATDQISLLSGTTFAL
jgi:hypothetical protein